MKKYFWLLIFLIAVSATKAESCEIIPSPQGVEDYPGQYVYPPGTTVTLNTVGCNPGSLTQEWRQYSETAVNVLQYGGFSHTLQIGSGVWTERRIWATQNNLMYPGFVYVGPAIGVGVGVKPANPEIEAGTCSFNEELGFNIAHIKIGSPDTDPWINSSQQYSVFVNNDYLGLEFGNNPDGTLEFDLILPPGSSRITVPSVDKVYNINNPTVVLKTNSTVSKVITCPGILRDEQTEDGNPTNTECSNHCPGGKPVNLGSGAMWHETQDFLVPGRTPATSLVLDRMYVAKTSDLNSDFGPNWRSNSETKLVIDANEFGESVNWVDENGGPWRFDYNSETSAYIPPGGLVASLSKLSDKYVLKKQDNSELHFDLAGKLIQIRDNHGEELNFTYSGNKVSRVYSAFAGGASYTRNESGKIISILRERDNLSYTYTYDSSGRLETATDFANRSYRYTYNAKQIGNAAHGLLETITDPIGRVTRFTYYDDGRAYQQFESGGGTRTFSYSNIGGSRFKKLKKGKRFNSSAITSITEFVEIDGTRTTHYFDKNYRTLEIHFNDGSVMKNTWNENGFLASQTDQLGNVTLYTYDDNGNVTAKKRPADSGTSQMTYNQQFNVITQMIPAIGAPTNYSIDSNTGDILQIQRSDGQTTMALNYTRDSFGGILETNNGRAVYADVRNANGFITTKFDTHNPQSIAYDSRGRVSTSTYLSGRVLNYTYDDDDRLITMADSHGPDMSYSYDPMGRKLSETMTDGSKPQTKTFVWDEHNRLVSEADALGNKTKYFYDLSKIFSSPIRKVDAKGRATLYEYDILNRKVKEIDPRGAITRFAYNLRGDLISVTDPVGNSTFYSYDGNGRKISEDRPSVAGKQAARHLITYTYDDVDNLLSEIHHSATGGNNRSIIYTYDMFDRLVNKKIMIGATIEDEATYTYENQMDAELQKTASNAIVNLGFTKEATPPFSSVGFSIASVQSGNPLGLIEDIFAIGRDTTGNIASITGANFGQVYTKAYDPAGRLTAVDAGALKTALAYDSFGRKSKIAHSDGAVGNIAYDHLNRITGMIWKEKFKDSVQQYLKYDSVGNITAIQREHSRYDLEYDGSNQLTRSKFRGMDGVPAYSRNFQYDLAGNRNDGETLANFLLQSASSRFLADSDGLGQTEKEITGDQVKNYSYRADGKIASFNSGTLTVNYLYDGLDRLVAKAVSPDGTPFTQSYVHLSDETRVLLGRAGDNSITAYIDGQGVAEHLGEVKGGLGKGYITDHLGSVLNTTISGESNAFGLFGEKSNSEVLVAGSAPVVYGFTGHFVDSESGLNRTAYRQYNPESGRWLTSDPLGFSSSDLNYYRYALSNPLRFTDATGLDIKYCDAFKQNVELVKLINQTRSVCSATKIKNAYKKAQETSKKINEMGDDTDANLVSVGVQLNSNSILLLTAANSSGCVVRP